MRKSWTEQMIATELSAIIASDRVMPSASRLRQLGRNDLAVKISRTGGFIAWAKRLGASREHSDSDTGWNGEVEFAKKLAVMGFSVTRMDAVKSPYDLRVNGCVRVDVKSAKYAEYGPCRGWFYRVGKEPQADIIALYQIDTKSVYFIPWSVCPVSNVTISRDGGKWSPFKDRYDILRELIAARSSETNIWPSPL